MRALEQNRCPASIVAFQSSINDDTESFGICTKSTGAQPPTMRSNDCKVEKDTLKYNEIQEMLTSSAYEVEPLQTADVAPERALTMLKQAISAYYVTSTLNKSSKRCFF